jgi:hypothetical protein
VSPSTNTVNPRCSPPPGSNDSSAGNTGSACSSAKDAGRARPSMLLSRVSALPDRPLDDGMLIPAKLQTWVQGIDIYRTYVGVFAYLQYPQDLGRGRGPAVLAAARGNSGALRSRSASSFAAPARGLGDFGRPPGAQPSRARSDGPSGTNADTRCGGYWREPDTPYVCSINVKKVGAPGVRPEGHGLESQWGSPQATRSSVCLRCYFAREAYPCFRPRA